MSAANKRQEDSEALADRIDEVRARVAGACARASRSIESVTLVAVSKTVAADTVRAAHALGLDVFGENRAQELLAKAASVDGCTWHMIGRVQTNKVRALAGTVAMWHSVDRTELVDALARRSVTAPVLIEVNVGDEPSKGGCSRTELDGLLDRARAAGLDVRGLMAVPPPGRDPRPHFAWLQEAAARHGLGELSMGMSGDYEIAIECGATLVRIGTAIFGARPPISPLGAR